MADFVYRGVPIEENGVVVAVQPVRTIEQNGVHYRGVLGVDSRGHEFVYNKYPNTGVTPVEPKGLYDMDGFRLLDSGGNALFVRR
jgi:hypothetical protein